MTDTNIITVSEFGQFAPEVDTARFDSPTISGVISQASSIVSDILDYTPLAETLTVDLKGTITSKGDLVIFPPKVPVQSVTGINIIRGTTNLSMTLQAGGIDVFNIDFNKRKILYPYEQVLLQGNMIVNNFFMLRNYDFILRLAYRGGFEVSELPPIIKRATVLIVKDIFNDQQNSAGASRITQGGITLQYSSTRGGESEFVKEAKRLLAPYVR